MINIWYSRYYIYMLRLGRGRGKAFQFQITIILNKFGGEGRTESEGRYAGVEEIWC